MTRRGWRNYDAAARPGPRYQGEAEFVHGQSFRPKEETKRKKFFRKQEVRDTHKRLEQ